MVVLVDGAGDDGDVGALVGETLRDSRADAPGRSRDDGPATGHETAR